MQTDQTKLLIEISSFLDTHKIPYMITGAWSAIFYGRPRASHDIDFVVELGSQDLERSLRIFSQLPEKFMVQTLGIREAIQTKGMFNIIHLPTMLKLDFWILTDEEFDKSRFKRKKRVKILGQVMEMASAEDTIIQKLKWYQMGQIEKHLIDAAFIYQIQEANLDKKYLQLWVTKLRLKEYYQQLNTINLEKYF